MKEWKYAINPLAIITVCILFSTPVAAGETKQFVIKNNLGLATEAFIIGISGTNSIALNYRKNSQSQGITVPWKAGAFDGKNINPYTLSGFEDALLTGVSYDNYVLLQRQNENYKPVYYLTNGIKTKGLGLLGIDYSAREYISGGGRIEGISDGGNVLVFNIDWYEYPDGGGVLYKYSGVYFNNEGLHRINPMNTFDYSHATGVSRDGSIIVGYDTRDPKEGVQGTRQAIRFSAGKSEALKNISGSYSVANAVSGDGKVIVGASTFSPDTNAYHAVKWVNDEVYDLGVINNYDTSEARSVNNNGEVIVGSLKKSSKNDSSFVWKDGKMTELRKLRKDAETIVQGVSPDGSILWGESDARRVLWKYGSPETEGLYDIVDTKNTVKSIGMLASDIFSSIEKQKIYLNDLRGGCGQYRTGDFCYDIHTADYRDSGGNNILSGFSIGKNVSDGLTIGVSVDTGGEKAFRDNYIKEKGYWGVGVFSDIRPGFGKGDMYIRPSVSFNTMKQEVSRPHLENTDNAVGDAQQQGISAAMIIGKKINIPETGNFDLYTGIQYTKVMRDGYTEKKARVPFTFSQIKEETAEAVFGIRYEFPVSEKMHLYSSAETSVNMLMHNNALSYDAYSPYVGKFSNTKDKKFPQGYISAGVSYAVNNAINISLEPKLHRSATGQYRESAVVSISGNF